MKKLAIILTIIVIKTFILVSKSQAGGIIQEQISSQSPQPTAQPTSQQILQPTAQPTSQQILQPTPEPPQQLTPQPTSEPLQQLTPQSTPDQSTLSNIPKPNLDNLGEPYWLNRNICRDNNGSIVCVTLEQAKRLRWVIPSKKR